MFGTHMDTIISHLIEQNYLNETRFAEQFVRGKFNIKKWGKRRLIRELKQRHISDWNIKNAMKEISDKAYWECGQVLAEKFWECPSNRPLAVKKKKVWNAMQYRGWETESDYGKYPKTGTSKRITQSQKSITLGHRNQIGLPILRVKNIVKIQC